MSWVPVAFGGTGVLVLADWALAASVPKPAAWILFLLVSGFGPLLGSGFWLIVSERFDPHTAKKVFGQIAGAGTLGGMLGGLGAAWMAAIGGAGAMLPVLAGLSLAGAWLIRRLAKSTSTPRRADDGPEPSTQSVLRTLAEAHYLRNLAALVLLLTIATTFVDRAFKTQVQTTFAAGRALKLLLVVLRRARRDHVRHPVGGIAVRARETRAGGCGRHTGSDGPGRRDRCASDAGLEQPHPDARG
jgi:hypothetical protein